MLETSKANQLQVRELRKVFPIKTMDGKKRSLVAVDNVSFDISPGEVLALVGESGSGKSTIGKMLLALLPASSGAVTYGDQSVLQAKGPALRKIRSELQIVFQDPFSSLNPNMRVGEMIGEVLDLHFPELSKADRLQKISSLLTLVGLRSEHATRYPHQFSGGQRQRLAIARAVAVSPSLIVADEPVSALDVSVRAQILNLLQDLQRELGLSMLFISHDLGVVRHIADRVMVLYLGRVMEIGSVEDIYDRPLHPYTRALMSAAPSLDPDASRDSRMVLQGEIPSPISPPSGCVFRTRCPHAIEVCAGVPPQEVPLSVGTRTVACHRAAEFLKEPSIT
jgi:oligopeptide/dipeptide ABC transporter ATP-binding protein